MSLFDRVVVGALPLVPRPLVGYFSRPYIAGTTPDDAMREVRSFNQDGMMATLDILGEHITKLQQAEEVRDSYLTLLDEIQAAGVDSNVSIKPTAFGLSLDPEAAYGNVRAVVAKAAEMGNFVRVDMEDSSTTTETIRLFHRLRREFSNTGLVLQSMLRRTLSDAEELARSKTNIRLCKGIYVEPKSAAYQDPELVNRNFVLVLEHLLENGCYVGIATHDERLVWESMRLVRKLGLGREEYEFQMLLGVEEELRKIIVGEGHRLRVYVPYGEHWYAYSVRRLRENPHLAGTMARKVLFGRFSANGRP